MCEPRRGDQLEELISKYYRAIEMASTSVGNPNVPSGALFLAVYRGKISEGLDFSDNNARAVVAVSRIVSEMSLLEYLKLIVCYIHFQYHRLTQTFSVRLKYLILKLGIFL